MHLNNLYFIYILVDI